MAEGSSSEPKVTQTRSNIWRHFNVSYKMSEDGKSIKVAKCLYCENATYTQGPKSNISTGNLKYHIEKKHPEYNTDLRLSMPNSDVLDNAKMKLYRWIVLKDQPFSVAEDPTFQELLRSIDPSNSIVADSLSISAKTVKSDLFELYSKEIVKVCAFCKDSISQISFTLDAWTAPNRIPFLGVTAHWVSEQWKLKSILLGFVYFPSRHTGVHICDTFLDLINERQISKVLAITMDNASNNDTFTKELEKRSPQLGLRFRAGNRIRCLAHVLHISVTVMLQHLKSKPSFSSEEEYGHEDEDISHLESSIGSTVAKIRAAIVKIRLSNNKEEALRRLVESFGLGDITLILDVKTRWNSTYMMLARALRLKPAFQSILKSDNDLQMYNMTETEWEDIASFVDILNPFDVATKKVSSESNPTISLLMPVYLWLLEKLHLSIQMLNEGLLKEACMLAKNKLEDYKDMSNNEAHWIAVVLDPTLKMDFFKDHYSKTELKNIKATVLNIFNEYYDNSDESIMDREGTSADADDLYSVYPKRSRRRVKGTELLKYLKDELLPPHTDKLEWWKANEGVYPTVSKMARDYLSIQGSSVSSERHFSGGANLISKKRWAMKQDTISCCMCLKSWWKHDY